MTRLSHDVRGGIMTRLSHDVRGGVMPRAERAEARQ
jgi:hypothetical protein